MKLVAIVLILVGALAVGYQGFTYVTREKVVDLGPVEVTKEHKKTVSLPPLIGGLILVGGIALLVLNSKKV
jgi:UDP-N-acetylmuramyl pentapeptide phosphotransferase/UDP-N-acetylglucosamine-1-phosphate transferase